MQFDTSVGYDLFQKYFNETPHSHQMLPMAGSDRSYVRLMSNNHTALWAYNVNMYENAAFIAFSVNFISKHIPVPLVYIAAADGLSYLLEDLGNITLFDLIIKNKHDAAALIKATLAQLVQLQINGHKDLNYGVCFNGQAFDANAIMADLFYFKYYFLRPQKIIYNGQEIINNFQTLTEYVLEADNNFFMMRDCQSRNVMIKDDSPYFIDYQGGKKGPLQYDIVSLLWQARADFTKEEKNDYIDYYCQKVAHVHPDFDKEKFLHYLPAFVFIRILQTLGSYGYRGLFERREHFLKSIPLALLNLKQWLKDEHLPIEINELITALTKLTEAGMIEKYKQQPQAVTLGLNSKLKVYVNSFSFKQKLPDDASGNGGGFVFDCRIIYNPGRHEEYKHLTGRDEVVKKYIEENTIMPQFMHNVKQLVNEGVKTYIERGFDSLQINFGCTGGQHRSVYAADACVDFIKKNYNVDVVLHHIEQEKKNWVNA